MIQYGLAVGRRVIIEYLGTHFVGAAETGPELPRFHDRIIEALAIVGTEQVPVSLFINRVRAVVLVAFSHPGYFGFFFRLHLVLLSARVQ